MSENNVNITFKLGLYQVSVSLLGEKEEIGENLIEQALDMLLLDTGIDVVKISRDLQIDLHDKKYVEVIRENESDENYVETLCRACSKKKSIKRL